MEMKLIRDLWPELKTFFDQQKAALVERQAQYQESLHSELVAQIKDPSLVEETEDNTNPYNKIVYIGIDEKVYPKIQTDIAGTPDTPAQNIFKAAIENVARKGI